MARKFRRTRAHVVELDAPRQYVALGFMNWLGHQLEPGDLVPPAEDATAVVINGAVQAGRIAPVIVPNGFELRPVTR